MFTQFARASRISAARVARQAVVSKRTLITPTAVRRADIVQEMYLKELKSYRPTHVKASDAEGQVSVFHIPATPKSPESIDIANELKAYESQVVELEGQAVEGEAAVPEENWFEEEPEEDAHAH